MDTKNSTEEKNLSNRDYRRKFIIHRSDLKLDVTNITLTVIAWIFTFFCFRNVLYAIFDIKTDVMYEMLPTFIKDWLSYEIHSVHAITPPWRILSLMVAFVIIVVLLEIVWVVYNHASYGAAERRKRRPLATKEEILKLYNVTEEQYETFQNGKCLSLSFNEGTGIDAVKPLEHHK